MLVCTVLYWTLVEKGGGCSAHGLIRLERRMLKELKDNYILLCTYCTFCPGNVAKISRTIIYCIIQTTISKRHHRHCIYAGERGDTGNVFRYPRRDLVYQECRALYCVQTKTVDGNPPPRFSGHCLSHIVHAHAVQLVASSVRCQKQDVRACVACWVNFASLLTHFVQWYACVLL